eukprot:Gb_40074 [translate_table: standard]
MWRTSGCTNLQLPPSPSPSQMDPQGIEDSIRRCEELLTMTPVAFTPGESIQGGFMSARRSFESRRMSFINNNAKLKEGAIGHDLDWKNNMDLLCGKQPDTTHNNINSDESQPESDSEVVKNSQSNFPRKLLTMDSYITPHVLEIPAMLSHYSSSNGYSKNNLKRNLSRDGDSCTQSEDWTSQSSICESHRGLQVEGQTRQQAENGVEPSNETKCENTSSENDEYYESNDDVSRDFHSNTNISTDNADEEEDANDEGNVTKNKDFSLPNSTLHSVGYYEEEEHVNESCYGQSEEEFIATARACDYVEQELEHDSEPELEVKSEHESEPQFEHESKQEVPRERELSNTVDSQGFEEEQHRMRPSGDSEEEEAEGLTARFGRLSTAASAAADSMGSMPAMKQSNKKLSRSKSVPKECLWRSENNCLTNEGNGSSYVIYGNGNQNSTERLKLLSRPRTEVYKKLSELKALLESEQLQECSFKETRSRISVFCSYIREDNGDSATT